MKLSVKSVSKSFNNRKILQNISFEVKKGEFVSIIGPSGSGKSTLFHIIGGILSPDEGRIYMNDEDVTNQSGYISYMPQNPSLFPWRTVTENAMLGQELSMKTDVEEVNTLLRKANLLEMANAYPHELSGGMKQRVAFIRALLSPQPIICLDEPFSALDAFTRFDMQKWLLNIWEEHERSVLFVTHDLEEAIFLADKIVVLSTNPATVKKVVHVPFQRPRDERILQEVQFFQLKRDIMQMIVQHT